MVKALRSVDLHLGVENLRADSDSGLHTPFLAFLHWLDDMVQCALQERVDLVLVARDAYRSRDRRPTFPRESAHRVHRLTAANAPAFLLIGNRDLPTARASERWTPLQALKKYLPLRRLLQERADRLLQVAEQLMVSEARAGAS